MIELRIAREFSRTPGPRQISEGDFSGETFRVNILAPLVQRAVAEHERLLVDLDGTAGCGTSFLEEAFGGLIRHHGYTLAQIRNTIEIKSNERPYYKDNIENEYLPEAEEKRIKGERA